MGVLSIPHRFQFTLWEKLFEAMGSYAYRELTYLGNWGRIVTTYPERQILEDVP